MLVVLVLATLMGVEGFRYSSLKITPSLTTKQITFQSEGPVIKRHDCLNPLFSSSTTLNPQKQSPFKKFIDAIISFFNNLKRNFSRFLRIKENKSVGIADATSSIGTNLKSIEISTAPSVKVETTPTITTTATTATTTSSVEDTKNLVEGRKIVEQKLKDLKASSTLAAAAAVVASTTAIVGEASIVENTESIEPLSQSLATATVPAIQTATATVPTTTVATTVGESFMFPKLINDIESYLESNYAKLKDMKLEVSVANMNSNESVEPPKPTPNPFLSFFSVPEYMNNNFGPVNKWSQ